MQKEVAVFFGGPSNEHEISVITGMLAVNLLRGSVPVLPVYLKKTGEMVTGDMRAVSQFREPSRAWKRVFFTEGGLRVGRRRREVVALNCCHGGMGEDGTLSSLFHFYHIASASPDAAVSSVFMDKELGKIAARGLGLPVLPAFSVHPRDRADAASRAEELGYPVIVKPSRLGSSIGIKVAKNGEELERALCLAFRLDDGALVEKYLCGKRDLNCAAFRKGEEIVVSPVEEVFSDEDILTFSEKYEGTGRRASAFPANLPAPLFEAVQKYTKTLYESFHVRGVVRADFLLAEDKVYFNELNTVPGSLACYLFGESLLQCKQFLLGLLDEAKVETGHELIQTGILDGGVFSGGKKGRLHR